MAANNRIFYACQSVAIGPSGEVLDTVHGVQSVGINTTFNLEQVFELGQLDIYENIENVPDIEVTLEKVLDGYPLMYRLATRKPGRVNPGPALVDRIKNRCDVALGIYPDTYSYASGEAPVQVWMSGMYVSSINYTLPTDGSCKESVTLVGNTKVWNLDYGPDSDYSALSKVTSTNSLAYNDGYDDPKNLHIGYYAGGVQRRENVIMQSSIMPFDIYGVTASSVFFGLGNNYNSGSAFDAQFEANKPKAHIQNITISADFGRDPIYELGRKGPYYRAASFPVEVKADFEVISLSGDLIAAFEEGNAAYINTKNEGNNTGYSCIVIQLQDGTKFDLGSKNKLTSVTYGGADAGGNNNATSTWSYTGYNILSITGPFNNAGESA
ncbi:hypothetical protein EB001_03935 [bacterium]|nr:hypothetical protein [bacterium]